MQNIKSDGTMLSVRSAVRSRHPLAATNGPFCIGMTLLAAIALQCIVSGAVTPSRR